MLGSDLRALQESYQAIYEETDGISCEMIEEVVEELVEECIEFGYTLDEAVFAVEEAAILYIDEAKVTYGSDTESPEQRRERAKAKVGEKRAAARKTAVKTAVGRAKAKVSGAKAAVGIAASIAKDEARRAGRKAVHGVKHSVEKKKQEVKSGIKGFLGKAARKVASKASSAAARLGEAVYGGTPATPAKPKDTRYTVTAADKKGNTKAYQNYKAGDKRYKAADHLGEEQIDEAGKAFGGGEDPCWKGYKQVGMKEKNGKEVPNCVPTTKKEELEATGLFSEKEIEAILEAEMSEGYKEIDSAKHGRMYDRYKKLRTAAMKDAAETGEASGDNRYKMGKMQGVISKSAENLRKKG